MAAVTSAPSRVDPACRCVIALDGVVQGIGLRPAVYRLAVQHGLAGSVRNTLEGVQIEAEGGSPEIRAFLADLAEISPKARITTAWETPRAWPREFTIEASDRDGVASLSAVPDLPSCEACLRDLTVPGDPRRGYPMTTCASCGPRFTIVRDLPYDRERTTMAAFTLCARCRAEYHDPLDRRFHAETIACPDCGPAVVLLGPRGDSVHAEDPIATAAHALRNGAIVAIKGVGGYHLACDATDQATVLELRRRKRRDAKPFAVMAKDVAGASAVASISDAEAELLGSRARPIVLAGKRGCVLADAIAPGMASVGVMLPYTPLHHLLLEAVDRPVVMTSANASDEPIAHTDSDALARLAGVADLFLVHDRAIHVACDDSVAQVVAGAPRVLRRSRGYVPGTIALPVAAPMPILACGGELKSTVALVRGGEAILSQHLGDLTSERAFRAYLAAIDHLRNLFSIAPQAVAHDRHPAYRSTLYARSLDGVEQIGVQHHHAHIASCLADNGMDRRVIGVAWDGSGYGDDGHVWGGEFLLADLNDFTRAGHLAGVPMPGGDAAVREPWRMAAAFLRATYGEAMRDLDVPSVRTLDRAAWRVLERAIDTGLNAPLTSSAGRLFDGVASLLGLRNRVSFEGQAAMELEAMADREADRIYAAEIKDADGTLVVHTADVIRAVVDDLLSGVAASRISARFHATVADVIVRVCLALRDRTAIAAVALSGGVFQNARLLTAALGGLEAEGFAVYTHRRVPCNDGGLSLGQAAVAARRLAGGAG